MFEKAIVKLDHLVEGLLKQKLIELIEEFGEWEAERNNAGSWSPLEAAEICKDADAARKELFDFIDTLHITQDTKS